MRIRVSSPGIDVKPADIDRIEKDLEKIDRRLNGHDVEAAVRLQQEGPARSFKATLEVKYRRNHFIAKATHADMGQAVRSAREEVLRQINDASPGGHSSMAKGR